MKILLCSEGSEQASRAVRLGAAIAAGCKAEVTLLGITEPEADSAQTLESLQKAQSALAAKGVPAEIVVKSGDPIRQIAARTEQSVYDMVVIGAVEKERGGLFWMSSKSYKIVKEVKPPVLVVTGPGTALKRILVCSGGRAYIHEAVKLTGEIARCVGAGVTLLHVLPEAPAFYAHWPRMDLSPERLLASASELGVNLRREKATLEELGVPTQVRLRDGSVLHEILQEVHEGQYDLVVTGSALHHGLRTYMLGDITREIVNRVRSAVLVVRPTEKPARFTHVFRDLFRHQAPGR